MYEHRSEPLLSRAGFARRLAWHALGAIAIIGCSLAIGTAGYAALGGFSPVDALLNASMILAGMGPVDLLRDDVAKLFASAYAIYSGVVFLVVVGVLFAPIFHRLLHRFHLDEDAG